MTTIFEQLGNEPTLEQVDAALTTLETEVKGLDERRCELETKIADGWGADTAKMETEYSRLESRIRASKGVFDRLQTLRTEALKRAAVVAYRQRLEALGDAMKAHNTADEKLAKALETLGALGNDHAQKAHRLNHEEFRERGAYEEARKLGVEDKELADIRKQFSIPRQTTLAREARQNIRL